MPVGTTTTFMESNGTTGIEILDGAVDIIDVGVVVTVLSEYTTDVYVKVLELPKSCTVGAAGGLEKN